MKSRRCIATIVALFALISITRLASAEEIPADKSDWYYFDGSNSAVGCYSDDLSGIQAKLDLMKANEGFCQADFTNWTNDWPGGEAITSYQFFCPAPGIPTGPYARKEERTGRYDGAIGTPQNCPSPTSRNIQLNRQFWYYCSDPVNFTLVGIPQPGGGIIPACRRKATSLDRRKQPKCPTVGNPICFIDGDKVQHETDYAGSGASPLTFTRSYSNFSMRHSYDRWLSFEPIIDSGGYSRMMVWAERPDGHAIPFLVETSAITNDADIVERLERVFSGTTLTGWRLKLADESVESYDLQGRLITITTRAGVTQTLTYDSLSRLVSVTDPFGHQLTLGYDSNGRLASFTDPAGGIYEYNYDSLDRLVSVTYPDSQTKTYVYDESAHNASGNMHALTGIIDEDSQRFATYEYDSQGRAITSEHAGGADRYAIIYNSDGSRDVTDAFGVTRNYGSAIYQNVGKLTQIAGPACPHCGGVQSYTYFSDGKVQFAYDFRGVRSNYGYSTDGRNLVTNLSEANGTTVSRTTTTQWHATYRLPTQITRGSRRTNFTHDSAGNILTRTVTDLSVTPNLTRTWTYTYNTFGQVLSENGPRTDVNDLTTYTYYTCTTGFQCGQIQTITNALGHVTTYNSYNAHGQPTQITDANSLVTSLAYDARKRLTDRCVGGALPSCTGGELTHLDYWPTGLLKKVTNPDGSCIEYLYDAAHRLTEIKDGALNRIVYTLDAMGNRTAENTYDPVSALSRTHTRVFNTLNQLWKDVNAAGTAGVTTELGYDANSNLTSTNAPLGRNSTQTYDEYNRLKRINDPNGGATRFTYNSYDQLTSVTDPRNLVTSYTYNIYGDVLTQTSPDTGVTTNTYDSAGNLDISTDSRGALSDFTYDVANRVTSVSFTRSGVTDQTINFGYDGGTNQNGLLTSASDTDHSLAWTYDTQGRVTGKGQTIGGITLAIGYGYNSAGQLGTVTLPSGNVVSLGYDSHGRVSGLALNGSTSILGSVTYDPFGLITGWTWGNGTTSTRTFDADGKVTQIENADGASLKNYAYDDAFRITNITDAVDSTLSWTYGYDLLDRLNSASKTGGTQGWTYDANGNRLSQTGSTTGTYTNSSTSNRLTSISGTPARSYTYDTAGNTLTFTGATFTYNNRGRMASATKAGVTATYTYNALGQRIRRTAAGITTLFVYDEAGHLAGEYSVTGTLIQETVWLGDIPIATLRSNGSGGIDLYYVHADHLNTPRLVTDTSNNLRWRWDSDPFGNTSPNENPSGLGMFVYNLRFPGQQYDAVAGLHYNAFRDYDSFSGRYVESDPIGLRGGNSTYAYVEGRPILLTDPSGLVPGARPSPPQPGIGDQFNPFGSRGNGSANYTDWFNQRFANTIAGAIAEFQKRIKEKICANIYAPVVAGLRGPAEDIDISPDMKRFGDKPQSDYERKVMIGKFELKTDDINVNWEQCDCFSFKTTMYVWENTGDNDFRTLFQERNVRMGNWPISGWGCCVRN